MRSLRDCRDQDVILQPAAEESEWDFEVRAGSETVARIVRQAGDALVGLFLLEGEFAERTWFLHVKRERSFWGTPSISIRRKGADEE